MLNGIQLFMFVMDRMCTKPFQSPGSTACKLAAAVVALQTPTKASTCILAISRNPSNSRGALQQQLNPVPPAACIQQVTAHICSKTLQVPPAAVTQTFAAHSLQRWELKLLLSASFQHPWPVVKGSRVHNLAQLSQCPKRMAGLQAIRKSSSS
jgi:hypothetical protein